DPVVAVAGDLAADAADRIAQRQRRRAHVEHPQFECVAPAHPADHANRAADRAAIPDEASAGEHAPDEVVFDLREVFDQIVGARADDAADQRGEHDLIGPVDGLAELAKPASDDQATSEETQREREAERLDRYAQEVYLGLHEVRI